MNFFVLAMVEDKPKVYRVTITSELQEELDALFLAQEQALRGDDVEEVPFDGSYSADESEILVIKDFVVPAELSAAAAHPLSVAPLDLSVVPLTAVYAFIGAESGRLLCQVFDRRRALTNKGLSIINTQGTFKRLVEQGLTLDDRLAAVLDKNTLRFRYFTAARRVFDLGDYYREATDEDLGDFTGSASLCVKDQAAFAAEADTWTRRKIAQILADGILDKVKPRALKKIAASYGIALQLVKVNGSEKILLPEERRELKKLLKFLDEDFFTSDITATRFISNSKRKAV